jgi:hypothetical protein
VLRLYFVVQNLINETHDKSHGRLGYRPTIHPAVINQSPSCDKSKLPRTSSSSIPLRRLRRPIYGRLRCRKDCACTSDDSTSHPVSKGNALYIHNVPRQSYSCVALTVCATLQDAHMFGSHLIILTIHNSVTCQLRSLQLCKCSRQRISLFATLRAHSSF